MRRKENRLNVRFDNGDIMDKIDIAAAQAGITASAFAKQAVIAAIRKINQPDEFSTLHTQKMLEMMAGPEVTKESKEYTSNYLEQKRSQYDTPAES